MSKTLIIREDQLNEIENGNSAYFDNLGGDFPEYIGNNEVTTGSDEKMPPKMQTTTDDVASFKAKDSYFGFGWNNGYARGLREIYTKKEFEEKILKETNNALNNINMNSVDGNGVLHTGDENAISTQETRARQRGDKETSKALRQTLKNYREPVKRQKELRKKLGLPVINNNPITKSINTFQKKGHHKDNNITLYPNN